MLEPWAFIVVGLAAFRLTRFFVYDSLVGSNLESGSAWSRRLDTLVYTAEGKDRSFLRGKIGDLLVCPWCLGFWLTVATWAVWRTENEPARLIVQLFALAGLAGLVAATQRALTR